MLRNYDETERKLFVARNFRCEMSRSPIKIQNPKLHSFPEFVRNRVLTRTMLFESRERASVASGLDFLALPMIHDDRFILLYK